MDEIQQSFKDDPLNQPISVDDASSMFRVKIPKNIPPYTKTVLEKNNQKVSKWRKTMLMDVASGFGGKLPAGKVQDMWNLFEEQYETTKLFEHYDKMPRMTKEQLDFWVDAFENKSVEELYDMGASNIAVVWQSLMTEIRMWYAEQKREHIFCSDNPRDWYNNARKNKKISEGQELPFWGQDIFAEIQEKVKTVLTYRVHCSK